MIQSVLTPTELAILEAVASTLIPSDQQGPGAADAAVGMRIIRSLVENPALMTTYTTGLSKLDQLARARYGSSVTGLPTAQLHQLLSFLDKVYQSIFLGTGSLSSRVRAKAYYWYYVKWAGLGSTLEFWKQVQSDVLAHFYSSPVAWAWLGYDGPPFPLGYVNRPKTTGA
jgi:hypothetical protein